MRWKYRDDNDAAESVERGAILKRIDNWWDQFACNIGNLEAAFRGERWDVPGFMQQHLQAISPQLMWEYGPAVACTGHRLVITPESARHLRPMVDVILARAKRLPNWEFYGYRLAEPLEMAEPAVHARTGGTLAGARVWVGLGEGHTIDVELHAPQCSGPGDPRCLETAFVAIECLLGEEVLDRWIGRITVSPLKQGLSRWLGGKSARNLLELDRLAPTVNALIQSVVEQLPDYFEPEIPAGEGRQHVGAVFELKPEQRDDYPLRSDLFVASTGWQELWLAMHGGPPFHSRRYARLGETFCYLKTDGIDPLPDKFPDRATMEDCLDGGLNPGAIGCVLGGGTGLRYSYIDLALRDVTSGIEIIRRILRDGNICRRTWLLFFDPELAREWVGIYDDTPAPPSELSK